MKKRGFFDLIYYKEDVIDEYSAKRKSLEKKDVEDLLRCALLFLEKEAKKKDFTALEIPNVGFLHKKLELEKQKKITRRISKEDNFIAECAYIETTFLPIVMRKDMWESYYPGLTKQELQQIQNNK